ncbi:MAG TPA: MauE/DoxX family redox-associated membrane protein, partial [Pyrinomonadaceae bacterium]
GHVRSHAGKWMREVPAFILAALFAVAAVDQLTHFGGVATAVKSYRLLPAGAERGAVSFIIMAELATALGILLRRWRRPACLAAVLLLSCFTAVYLSTSPASFCGSRFTLTLNTGGPVYILQNLVFIGLAVLSWADAPARTRADDAPPDSYLSHSTAT